MTAAEWEGQWRRLDPFRVGGDADRGEVSAEWFAQLKHHHVDAVDYGITQLIGSAKDTFLPGLGLLKDFIQARFDRYQRTDGKCQTCHGSTWIESAPFKSNGMIYEGAVIRCPDCGVPEPNYTAPNNRQSLSSREHAEWRMNDHNRQYMPAGQHAKPRLDGEQTEIKAAMDRLRIKLFGHRPVEREGEAS